MNVKSYILNESSSKYYDPKLWTYGSEYEFADLDKRVRLPDTVKWDFKDVTVMNSNGVATDPRPDKTRIVQYGGELNTVPCNSIDELVEVFNSVIKFNPKVNNSCNLHNHIFVPDLDLEGLKSIVAYFSVYRDDLVEYTDKIPTPEFDMTVSASEAKLINDRYIHHTKEHHGSRHGNLPKRVLDYKLDADSLEEFHKGSIYGLTKATTMSWSNANRAGINTVQNRRSDKKEHIHLQYEDRPYAESGTIEFRMHSMTIDANEYKSTLYLDFELMNAMLNTGESVKSIVDRLSQHEWFKLPEYIPLDPKLYKIYQHTKFKNMSDTELLTYLKENNLKYE